MSRLNRELSVIPRAVWVTAAVLYLLLAVILSLVIFRSPEAKEIPQPVPIFLVVVAPFIAAVMVLLYGYVYADAKRRAMRPVLWLLLAIFIPNAIGVILYFILREPLPVPCPSCAAPARPGFAYCPRCGTEITPACPECKRGIEPEWSNCAYCGARLK